MDGRSVRWEAHNAAQRTRIVEAAIALIETTGDLPSLLDVGQHAGVSRSVLYRQFADRNDLEQAVRTRGMEMFWEAFEPVLTLRGTVRESLTRGAAAYVNWAMEHRHLHQRADQNPTEGSELQRSIDLVADQIASLLVMSFRASGAQVSDADVEATDPLTHGLVNGIYSTVRRWLARGGRVPDAEHLIDLVVEAVEALIGSRATAFGIPVNFDAPVSTLIPSVQ